MKEQNSIYRKIADFTAKFKGVEKKRVNPFTKSNYANLDDVVNSAKDLLVELGMGITQPVEIIDGKQILKTILFDSETGDNIVSSIDLDAMAEKKGAQGYGSAMTYARRYALCALLGIVESADDDGNVAQGMSDADLNRLVEHNMAVVRCFDDIVEIKRFLTSGDRTQAMQYWNDVAEEDKHLLWQAPTKGGIFTTEERALMKGG